MTTPPHMPSRNPAVVEVVLLLAAIVAGTVLGVNAFGGGLEPAKVSGVTPTSAPTPGEKSLAPPSTPVDTMPPFPSGDVLISAGESHLAQGSSPCNIELQFHWEVAPEANVPIGSEAVIKASGPGLEPSYKKPVTSSGIDLRVKVTVKNAARWVASIQTVDGRTATPTPLELTVSDAFC